MVCVLVTLVAPRTTSPYEFQAILEAVEVIHYLAGSKVGKAYGYLVGVGVGVGGDVGAGELEVAGAGGCCVPVT